MKTILSLFFLLLLSSSFTTEKPHCNYAPLKNDVKFKLIRYGIYNIKIREDRPDSTSPSGNRGSISGWTLNKQTDTIPATIGTYFGVEFMIETDKNEVLPIVKHWKFPKPIYNTNTKQTFSEINTPEDEDTNFSTFTCYEFEEPFEQIPGPWVLTITYKKQVLFQKTFIVIK